MSEDDKSMKTDDNEIGELEKLVVGAERLSNVADRVSSKVRLRVVYIFGEHDTIMEMVEDAPVTPLVTDDEMCLILKLKQSLESIDLHLSNINNSIDKVE